MQQFSDSSFATELLIGARWLRWAPGIAVAEKDMLESQDLLDQAGYDPVEMNDATFASCTSVLVNYFLLSLVSSDVNEPSYWL